MIKIITTGLIISAHAGRSPPICNPEMPAYEGCADSEECHFDTETHPYEVKRNIHHTRAMVGAAKKCGEPCDLYTVCMNDWSSIAYEGSYPPTEVAEQEKLF
jgi:hypothetical protein